MEWISVEDKTPEIGQEVLVFAKEVEGEVYLNHFNTICHVEWYGINSSSVMNTDYYEVTALDVTHWMPIPRSPKD